MSTGSHSCLSGEDGCKRTLQAPGTPVRRAWQRRAACKHQWVPDCKVSASQGSVHRLAGNDPIQPARADPVHCKRRLQSAALRGFSDAA